MSASTRAVTTANEAPKQAAICRLFTECVAFEPGEFEANARLIASAPELLEIVKAYRNLLRTMASTEGELATFAHIESVLAKAEGVK